MIQNWMVINWKSRTRLTPEDKAALPPKNLLFLPPLQS